jgi:hypothetical protein
MSQKIYEVYLVNPTHYDAEFEDFICTEEVLKDYIQKFKDGIKDPNVFGDHGESADKIIVNEEEGYIKFGGWKDMYIKWREYVPKVVTSLGEMEEISWSCRGYEETWVQVDVDKHYD